MLNQSKNPSIIRRQCISFQFSFSYLIFISCFCLMKYRRRRFFYYIFSLDNVHINTLLQKGNGHVKMPKNVYRTEFRFLWEICIFKGENVYYRNNSQKALMYLLERDSVGKKEIRGILCCYGLPHKGKMFNVGEIDKMNLNSVDSWFLVQQFFHKSLWKRNHSFRIWISIRAPGKEKTTTKKKIKRWSVFKNVTFYFCL